MIEQRHVSLFDRMWFVNIYENGATRFAGWSRPDADIWHFPDFGRRIGIGRVFPR